MNALTQPIRQQQQAKQRGRLESTNYRVLGLVNEQTRALFILEHAGSFIRTGQSLSGCCPRCIGMLVTDPRCAAIGQSWLIDNAVYEFIKLLFIKSKTATWLPPCHQLIYFISLMTHLYIVGITKICITIYIYIYNFNLWQILDQKRSFATKSGTAIFYLYTVHNFHSEYFRLLWK